MKSFLTSPFAPILLASLLSFSACLESTPSSTRLPPDADNGQDLDSVDADEPTQDSDDNNHAGNPRDDDDARDASVPSTPPLPCDSPAYRGSCVRISGRRMFVDGASFHVKGIGYNPVPKGGTHPANLSFAMYAPEDIPLMKAAGVNTIRTYEPLVDIQVLDALHAAGMRVINTVYPWGGADVSVAIKHVDAVKEHPAILMWLVGNEWNYNHLYTGAQHDLAWTIRRVEEVARAIKVADPNHPVATSYGHIPTVQVLKAIPTVDVWGSNIYAGLGFATLFEDFSARSKKPLLITEYGADAYNSKIGREDQPRQAEATRVLTELIFDQASAKVPGAPCIGGTLYSWSDEWWKAGDPSKQDLGGDAPGHGPYPDGVFNEEYWGIVDIDRKPREAYGALREVYSAH